MAQKKNHPSTFILPFLFSIYFSFPPSFTLLHPYPTLFPYLLLTPFLSYHFLSLSLFHPLSTFFFIPARFLSPFSSYHPSYLPPFIFTSFLIIYLPPSPSLRFFHFPFPFFPPILLFSFLPKPHSSLVSLPPSLCLFPHPFHTCPFPVSIFFPLHFLFVFFVPFYCTYNLPLTPFISRVSPMSILLHPFLPLPQVFTAPPNVSLL